METDLNSLGWACPTERLKKNLEIPLDSECEVSIRDAGRLVRSALPEKGMTIGNEE